MASLIGTTPLRLRIAHALILCMATTACDLWPFSSEDETPMEVPEDGPDDFTTQYNHTSPSVTATIGLWMHKEQEFQRVSIADWLEVPHADKELLEPINVLWVDPVAQSEEEATTNVVQYLDDCDFVREGDVIFGLIPRHSSGYSASYGTGVWQNQHDPDDAWVEGFFGGDLANNHGRIFPAHPETSANGSPVYFTSGAFSREGPRGNPFFLFIDCLFSRENCHPYVSFNVARDKLACGAPGWTVSGPIVFPNIFPESMGLSFTTGDHDGVLIIEHTG